MHNYIKALNGKSNCCFAKCNGVLKKELVWILYSEAYFSFKESAHEYVEKLRQAIYNDLPHLIHHETPDELKRYGTYYAKIKGSKRTTWYVFFDNRGNRYLIEFITNNHTSQSTFLNRL